MDQRLDGTPKRGEEGTNPKGRRIDLSLPQVAGSALAAVAAAVLASQLGLYGTIIGAGVVSVIATCGGSVFQHLFRRTGEQIRVVTVQAKPRGRQVRARDIRGDPAAGPPGRPPLPAASPGEFGDATTHGTRVRGWKRPVLAAVVVFAVAMLGITGYELIAGQDLSGGRGTTVGSVVGGGDTSSSKTPPAGGDTGQDPAGGRGASPGSGRSPSPGAKPGDSPSGSTGPDGGGGTGGGTGDTPDAPSHAPTPTPSGGTATPPPSAPTPTPSAGDAGHGGAGTVRTPGNGDANGAGTGAGTGTPAP